MNNTQPNTDTENNSNCRDSLDCFKPKLRTVTFAINTIHSVNCQGPNICDRGIDTNNEYPSPSRNTKNQSSNSHFSGENSMPAWREKASTEITWKPGVLKLLNAKTIWNSKIWKQSNHKLTAQAFGGILNGISESIFPLYGKHIYSPVDTASFVEIFYGRN